MPWNTPSSQPTSWACAIRSSASTGVSPSLNGSVSRSSSSRSSGARPSSSSLIEAGVDLPQPVAAGVVQRRGPDLLEQLLDHRADPHDLGRLLDHVADVELPAVVVRRLRHGQRADRLAVGTDDDDLLRAVRCRIPVHVMPPSCPLPAELPNGPGGEPVNRSAGAAVLRMGAPRAAGAADEGGSRCATSTASVPGRLAGARLTACGRAVPCGGYGGSSRVVRQFVVERRGRRQPT